MESRFDKFGSIELEQIRKEMVRLTPLGRVNKTVLKGLGLDHEEPWFKGNLVEVLLEIDKITQKTKIIGERFQSFPKGRPERMKEYYWLLGPRQPTTKSVLSLDLCLVPEDEQLGKLLLGQTILKVEDDLYYYWGVD